MKSRQLRELANRLRLFANNGATTVKLSNHELIMAARACELVAVDVALQEKLETKSGPLHKKAPALDRG